MNPLKILPLDEIAVGFIFLITVGLLYGCSKDPVAISSSSNPQVPVETLFTHEGCTVYRFGDGGREHYFANCPQSTSATDTYLQSCGKGCVSVKDENITTNY